MLRNNESAKDEWLTPGGRILLNETPEEAIIRVLDKETGPAPAKVQSVGVMSHIWPNTHTVTAFYRVDVADEVRMNDEHRAFKRITEVADKLHPCLKEMIKQAEIFN
jgi:ADP-ribose pyrophosphatase YjhB (NUDIX family)